MLHARFCSLGRVALDLCHLCSHDTPVDLHSSPTAYDESLSSTSLPDRLRYAVRGIEVRRLSEKVEPLRGLCGHLCKPSVRPTSGACA